MLESRQLILVEPQLAGAQELLVRRIVARDTLSSLFEYDVLLCARSDTVDFNKVLGKEMCVSLELPLGGKRFFHGYVASFACVGEEHGFVLYRAQVRPHLWRLTRAINSRAFQNKTVMQIVQLILSEHGISAVETHLDQGNRSPYLEWDYCVQYRESDFAFISRLLEKEGIHYSFKHEQTQHTLVFSDTNQSHKAVPTYEQLEYSHAHTTKNRRTHSIWDWRTQQSVQAGLYAVTDYEFKKPKLDLAGKSGSEVDRPHSKGIEPDYEVFDHLETVVQQTGYTAKLSEDYARIRAEELHVQYASISAETDARGLVAGARFSLLDGPSSTVGQEYLLVSTLCSAENDLRTSGGGSHQGEYHCSLQGIDLKHPYRPARNTIKPVVPGPQSATVVGKGDHFMTDEWGRVRVKFHWNRADKDEDKMSCWVRVSQLSAGANWGSMFVPHIGQEVLVGFLEGDPDRPIVIGRVYNGNNPTPLKLPDNGYKSIVRDSAGNQVIWDSTPGAELFSIFAPSTQSLLQLGVGDRKSKGTVDSTKGDKISYSKNTKSFTLGSKVSYTKGYSWSVDRGFWGSVKGGAGFSAIVGTEIKASLGASIEFKAGVSVAYQYNTSMSWGFGREFKGVKGSYTRISDKDTLLDSKATAYVTGGRQDNTMMSSNDTELVLSFDDSVQNRSAQIDAMEKSAKASASVIAAFATGTAAVGALWHTHESNAEIEALERDGSVEAVEAEYHNLTTVSTADAGAAMAQAIATGLATKKVKFDVKPPKHPSPSARISLSKDWVHLYAGQGQEAEIGLHNHMIMLFAQDEIEIKSKEAAVKIDAKQDIQLKSSTAVIIDALLKHRNMQVLK